ncbi:hypothetical protein LJC71_01835 [Desulfosarcina sp. OttesenSCG-928-A07]|nr:hypothetical protein [Desulfosarcina sp. OttesenSCG-928-G17]MDL2328478.1 hypothetical protein [Desulfosarcina sp. OttesenSCG-928-A07]
MRMIAFSLVFVCALFLTGCSEKSPQPEASAKTATTENTINSTVNQSSEKSSDTSSDDELLKYIKERDAATAEEWRDATSTDKLEEISKRETGKAY